MSSPSNRVPLCRGVEELDKACIHPSLLITYFSWKWNDQNEEFGHSPIYIFFAKLVTKASLLQTSFKPSILIKTSCMQDLRHSEVRLDATSGSEASLFIYIHDPTGKTSKSRDACWH